jgi:hypothetical protein
MFSFTFSHRKKELYEIFSLNMMFFQSKERGAFPFLVNEVAWDEVKNLCSLMHAIFSEAVSDEIEKK